MRRQIITYLSGSRKVTLWLFLLLVGLGQSGCLSYVKLPNAPRFPSSVPAGAGGANAGTESILRSQVKKLSPQIWSELASFWGVEKVSGRLYLRLHFLRTKLHKCEFVRADIKATSKSTLDHRAHRKMLRTNLFAIHRRKRKGRGVCAYLSKQPWPSAKSALPIKVELILAQ